VITFTPQPLDQHGRLRYPLHRRLCDRRARLDAKKKIRCPCRETSYNSPSLGSAWSLHRLRHPDSKIFPGLAKRGGKKHTAINKILSPCIANVFEITNTGYENVIRVFTHTKNTLCTSVTRCNTTSWRSSSVLRSFYDVLTPRNGTSWTDMRISARSVSDKTRLPRSTWVWGAFHHHTNDWRAVARWPSQPSPTRQDSRQ